MTRPAGAADLLSKNGRQDLKREKARSGDPPAGLVVGLCWPISGRAGEGIGRRSASRIRQHSDDLDGSGKFPQTDGEHEEGRISVGEDRGLLPALPPGERAPVGTGSRQARRSDQETSPDRRREDAGDALGSSHP